MSARIIGIGQSKDTTLKEIVKSYNEGFWEGFTERLKWFPLYYFGGMILTVVTIKMMAKSNN